MQAVSSPRLLGPTFPFYPPSPRAPQMSASQFPILLAFESSVRCRDKSSMSDARQPGSWRRVLWAESTPDSLSLPSRGGRFLPQAPVRPSLYLQLQAQPHPAASPWHRPPKVPIPPHCPRTVLAYLGTPPRPAVPLPLPGFMRNGSGVRPGGEAEECGVSHAHALFVFFSLPSPSPVSLCALEDGPPALTTHRLEGGTTGPSSSLSPHSTPPDLLKEGVTGSQPIPHLPTNEANMQAVLAAVAMPVVTWGQHPLLILLSNALPEFTPNTGSGGQAGEAAGGPLRIPRHS